MEAPLKRTNLIWWRYGKENESTNSEICVNPQEVIQNSLDTRLKLNLATPENAWRWYQVSDELVVECGGGAESGRNGADTRYYYLLKQGYGVIENFSGRRGKIWYMHLADFFCESGRDCWVMKDMFVDVVAPQNLNSFWVIDLDDLATALDLGLVDAKKTSDILRRTEALAHEMRAGRFPTALVEAGRAACNQLGWK